MEFETEGSIERPKKDVNFKKYLLNLLKRWPYIVVFFVVSVLIGYAINRYSTPIYQVTARITTKKFSGKQSNIVPGLVDASFFLSGLTEVYEEIPILKSVRRIEATLDRVDFRVSYFAKGFIKEVELESGYGFNVSIDTIGGENYPFRLPIYVNKRPNSTFALRTEDAQWSKRLEGKTFRYGDPVALGEAIIRIENTSAGSGDDDKYYFVLNRKTDLINYYGNKLQISWAMKGSAMLDLYLESELPRRDIKFIRAYYQVVDEMGLAEKNETLENTIIFIDTQMKMVNDSLNYYQGLIDGLKLDNRKIASGSEHIFTQLDEIDAKRAEIILNERYFNYLIDYFRNNSQQDVFAPSLIGLSIPPLEEWVNKYISAKLLEKNLRTIENQNNPLVNREDSVKRRLEKGIFEAIRSARSRNKQTLQDLNQQASLLYASVSDVQFNTRSLARFERLYQINNTLYDLFIKRKAEAAISKASATSDYKVINAPTFSRMPIKPDIRGNLLMAAAIGLIVPVGFFLLKDITNTRIMDKDDLEAATSIPMLGNIAHSDYDSNLVVKEFPKSVVAESFRAIRANLKYLFHKHDSKSHVFLVTSSVGGEGKTFCSINLAYTLALSHRKTILLGADLRKPEVANYLEISSRGGLSSYLAGFSELDGLIIKGGDNEPDIIDAGKIPPNPAELLGSERMRGLIENLRNYYQYIIIDTPPIGLVSDAVELFKLSDYNILIVRQGVTSKAALRMIDELQYEGKLEKFNIVFNDIELSKRKNSVYGSYVYGLGYGGYGYGYYEEDGKKRARKRSKNH